VLVRLSFLNRPPHLGRDWRLLKVRSARAGSPNMVHALIEKKISEEDIHFFGCILLLHSEITVCTSALDNGIFIFIQFSFFLITFYFYLLFF
jgi:hypothetical protein